MIFLIKKSTGAYLIKAPVDLLTFKEISLWPRRFLY